MSKHEVGVSSEADASIEELRDGIKHTREEMTSTLGALENRLNPGALGEKANEELDHLEARVKSALKEGIEEAKTAAAVTLKEGMQEAKDAVAHGLKEARETVRNDLHEAITHTKHSVREATLGRVEDLATQAGDVMNDTRDTLIETVRNNPIPAALAGIGIAWLLMNRSSANRKQRDPGNGYPYRGYGPESDMNASGRQFSRMGETLVNAEHAVARTAGNVAHRVGDAAGQVGGMIGNVAGQVGGAVGHAGQVVVGAAHDAGAAAKSALNTGTEAVTHFAHDAQATAGQLAHSAQDMAGSVAGTAREQARRVEGGVAAAWEANPIAFGAAALVAGAAIGYALPRTAKEDELMGDIRDHVVHEAAAMATDAVHSLQHVAENVGKAAKDSAKASTTTA